MLSVDKCRKCLANDKYSDKQVEEIRDALYQLANILVEEYLTDKRSYKEEGKK